MVEQAAEAEAAVVVVVEAVVARPGHARRHPRHGSCRRRRGSRRARERHDLPVCRDRPRIHCPVPLHAARRDAHAFGDPGWRGRGRRRRRPRSCRRRRGSRRTLERHDLPVRRDRRRRFRCCRSPRRRRCRRCAFGVPGCAVVDEDVVAARSCRRRRGSRRDWNATTAVRARSTGHSCCRSPPRRRVHADRVGDARLAIVDEDVGAARSCRRRRGSAATSGTPRSGRPRRSTRRRPNCSPAPRRTPTLTRVRRCLAVVDEDVSGAVRVAGHEVRRSARMPRAAVGA